MRIIEYVVGIVDKFIKNKSITDEEYEGLSQIIKGMIKLFGYNTEIGQKNSIDSLDVTNEFLSNLLSGKCKYNTEFNTRQKKKYINFLILKAIQNVIQVYRNYLDDSTYKSLHNKGLFNGFISNNIMTTTTATQDEEDNELPADTNNIILVDQIIRLLPSFNNQERQIFSDFFLANKTQEQIANEIGVTQQRVSHIICDIKNRISSSIVP